MELRYCEKCGDVIPSEGKEERPPEGEQFLCARCAGRAESTPSEAPAAPAAAAGASVFEGILEQPSMNLFSPQTVIIRRKDVEERQAKGESRLQLAGEAPSGDFVPGSPKGSSLPAPSARKLQFRCLGCRATLLVRPVQKLSRFVCPKCKTNLFIDPLGIVSRQGQEGQPTAAVPKGAPPGAPSASKSVRTASGAALAGSDTPTERELGAAPRPGGSFRAPSPGPLGSGGSSRVPSGSAPRPAGSSRALSLAAIPPSKSSRSLGSPAPRGDPQSFPVFGPAPGSSRGSSRDLLRSAQDAGGSRRSFRSGDGERSGTFAPSAERPSPGSSPGAGRGASVESAGSGAVPRETRPEPAAPLRAGSLSLSSEIPGLPAPAERRLLSAALAEERRPGGSGLLAEMLNEPEDFQESIAAGYSGREKDELGNLAYSTLGAMEWMGAADVLLRSAFIVALISAPLFIASILMSPGAASSESGFVQSVISRLEKLGESVERGRELLIELGRRAAGKER